MFEGFVSFILTFLLIYLVLMVLFPDGDDCLSRAVEAELTTAQTEVMCGDP